MSYIWLTRILLFAVVLVAARKGGEAGATDGCGPAVDVRP
jgi:hypothetical protein